MSIHWLRIPLFFVIVSVLSFESLKGSDNETTEPYIEAFVSCIKSFAPDQWNETLQAVCNNKKRYTFPSIVETAWYVLAQITPENSWPSALVPELKKTLTTLANFDTESNEWAVIAHWFCADAPILQDATQCISTAIYQNKRPKWAMCSALYILKGVDMNIEHLKRRTETLHPFYANALKIYEESANALCAVIVKFENQYPNEAPELFQAYRYSFVQIAAIRMRQEPPLHDLEY